MTGYKHNYSSLDQQLHNIAFRSASAQTSLSRLEDRLFRGKLSAIEIRKPVFITALPRAGTTLLLEVCVTTGEFASHTYRNMPFLFTPLLWNLFSKIFRKSEAPQERAHGDGMMVSVESPEAFEEMIWKVFWASRYRSDRIVPWTKSDYPEFEGFFRQHMRKLVFLQNDTPSTPLRYLSKNNLNIARLGILRQMFPDAIFIVPFRDPFEHASSLLQQHRNFLRIHDATPFSRVYMEAIGHYDFGATLRPVDFDGWFSNTDERNPDMLSFWLRYWVSSYRYLLGHACDYASFVSYESLLSDPAGNLAELGKLIEVENVEALMINMDRIKAPKPYAVDTSEIAAKLLAEAKSLNGELRAISLFKN